MVVSTYKGGVGRQSSRDRLKRILCLLETQCTAYSGVGTFGNVLMPVLICPIYSRCSVIG